MKIKSLTLFAALILAASASFAKEAKLHSSVTEKRDPIEETRIKPFDFNKVFKDAETYFKAAKAWNKLKCAPKTGFVCNKKECYKKDIKDSLLLDKTKKTITRCEGETCETFPAQFAQTGVFYNIQSDGPVGTLIRVLGDSRYKEITTVGLDAYIANGECTVITD